MFPSSQSIKACFLYLSIASSGVLKTRAYTGAKYATLVLPVNVTDWISTINDTIPSNETTIFPNRTLVEDDISWPEGFASPRLSSPPVSAPSSNSFTTCNGKAYGKNLNVASCIEALNKMPSNDEDVTFGQRGEGTWGGNLPFRILSSDGRCALDLSHRAGVISDRIKASELKENARVLIDICVKGTPNQGGVVGNIGENGNLAIRVTPYRPNVHCAPHGMDVEFMAGCRYIIDEMPVDETKQILGQKGNPDPEVTIKLPAGYNTPRKSCELFIDTLVPTMAKDASNWYKLCAYHKNIPCLCRLLSCPILHRSRRRSHSSCVFRSVYLASTCTSRLNLKR